MRSDAGPGRAGLLARVTALSALLCAAAPIPGIGTTATPEEIAPWNIDIRPDGAGLPPGSGSVAQGEAVYQRACQACHGAAGQDSAIAPALVGGIGSLATAHPVKTVGSYWPYATTLFDYVRRAMPLNAPQSLPVDDVYAVSAYVLHLNGLVPADATMDAASLPKVEMPNRNGFRQIYQLPR